jgi:DNA repair exonuclease SbcCD ATPase subunit
LPQGLIRSKKDKYKSLLKGPNEERKPAVNICVEWASAMENEVATNLERCPLCDTELSQVKFREIQTKLRDEKRKRDGEIEQEVLSARRLIEVEFQKTLLKETQAATKKASQEAELQLRKLATERDQVSNKLNEARDREATIRKEAQLEIQRSKQAFENNNKEQIDQLTKKAAAERAALNKQLQDAQNREAKIRKQVQEAAEQQRQKELGEQRAALEKDKEAQLLKQQAVFARERESLQKKMLGMKNQLDKKTANELGDGAEIDLFEALRESFADDRISRYKKGETGADIMHEVLHRGEVCG